MAFRKAEGLWKSAEFSGSSQRRPSLRDVRDVRDNVSIAILLAIHDDHAGARFLGQVVELS